ncbi:MAG: phosphoglucomutase/phosphomannomutase family protein [Cyanobacteria bacterium]|nr:phosphoglucomutase/phosphomannomutase family protein [Cyanobacteriota bacterium]
MMMGSKQGIKFGTDGWRAIIADEFTFENVAIVASGVARYLVKHFSTEKPVVIGYDTRFMAEQFARKAAAVMNSYGFSVLLTHQYTPTPIVAFAAKSYESAGALMFTASHNPPEYCGIKFIPHYAGPATPEITDELMTHIKEVQVDGKILSDQSAGIETFNPLERYLPFLATLVKFDLLKAHPIKILYDPMHGAGQGYLDGIYKQMTGLSMTLINDGLDPYFGGHIPEPKDEWLPELMKAVPAQGFDLGMANDGDADRFGIVDDTGRFLSANEILPLLLRYLYKHRGYRGSVVRTVATSMLLNCLADQYGIVVHETKVGFKYVGEIMRQEPVIIGGEESGGLSILGHIPEKDGILADLLVAEMIAVEQKPLSQIFNDLLKEVGVNLHQISINLHIPDAQKKGIMDALNHQSVGESFAGKPIQSIDKRDGVKFMFGAYEWVLVRPSGTEPILRLYGESEDPQFLKALEVAVKAAASSPLPVVS